MQRIREAAQNLRVQLEVLKVRAEPAAPYAFAVIVGAGAAAGAIVFRELIADFDRLFFGWLADDVLGGLGDWRVVLIPAIGGLFVGPIIYFFAREAKGHGVPEVMLALEAERGRIRPRVAVVKSVASAICIGSGGSVGREGPIVQIASAIGSTIGQIARLSDDDVRLLVAAGAAGGISATFNAPIAGVFFALEVILRRFNARNFGVVVLSSVVATAVAHARFGDQRAFLIPEYTLESPFEYPLYAVLGVIAAFAAVLFVWLLYKCEDLFDAVPIAEWVKPAVGGIGVGLLGVAFIDVLGVGYGSGPGGLAIPSALEGDRTFQVLVALAGLKILATSVTIGSGGSGGVFAPSLFIGAMAGGAFGSFVNTVWPGNTGPSGAYALVGMGAVFAGGARAPITAIIILFEMTRDYSIILPLMTAVVISTVVAQLIMRESIYTLKISRRGIELGEPRERSVLARIAVGRAWRPDFEVVNVATPLEELMEVFSGRAGREGALPVVDDQRRLVGVVAPSDLDKVVEGKSSAQTVEDVATKNPVTVYPDETLDEAVRRMGDRSLRQLPIVSRGNRAILLGVLRRSDVFAAYSQAAADTPIGTGRSRRAPLMGLEAYGMEVVELLLGEDAPAVAHTLGSLDLPRESVVISIVRDGRAVIPRGDVTFSPGDRVVVAVLPKAKAHVTKKLTGAVEKDGDGAARRRDA